MLNTSPFYGIKCAEKLGVAIVKALRQEKVEVKITSDTLGKSVFYHANANKAVRAKGQLEFKCDNSFPVLELKNGSCLFFETDPLVGG